MMSADKQGTVKSELSPDGGLKLTIKRDKMVDAACEPEWVTEARGGGLGKLVIKRKCLASVSQSSATRGSPPDRPAEQRPILRLSLTSSALSDGTQHAEVKSWSLCEVASAVEDIASAAELSPACQLQPSPKDSGIDISSPPHDDGAVGVEVNSGAGIWNDCHTGNSSAVEEEKTATSVKQEETATGSITHAAHASNSSTKTVWSDTASLSATANSQPKIQTTLRSRRERSVLKSFTSNSQKLVNPLAKTHRVGRYQHMLPVHRIRAESNVNRRSSLEESPTYNMVASRASSSLRLPRVKTKLKLLSNNRYAPVFDQDTDNSEQHSAAQKSNKCSDAEKSTVVEPKGKRFLCRSPASDTFENVKVELCFVDQNSQTNLESDKVQKLPKLKFFVKSEPSVSVSCVEQRLESESVAPAVKHAEQNVPRQKRGQRDIREKARSSNTSSASAHPAGECSVSQLLSPADADVKSIRSKRKSSSARSAAASEQSGKKSKVLSCAEELVSHLPQKLSEDHIDETVLAVHDMVTTAEKASDAARLSSFPTEELAAGQTDAGDVYSEADAVPEVAGKYECMSVDPAKVAELDSAGTDVTNTSKMETDDEQCCTEGLYTDIEKTLTSNSLVANSDNNRSEVHSEDKSSLPDAVQHDSVDDSSVTCDNDVPCVMNGVSADDRQATYSSCDHSEKSYCTCAMPNECSCSVYVEQSTTDITDTVVPLLPQSLLVGDISPTRISSSSLLPHTDSHKLQDSNLSTSPTSVSVNEQITLCDTVDCQNVDAINSVCLPASEHVDTVSQQDVKQDMTDAKEQNELKSVCAVLDHDQKPVVNCEEMDSEITSCCEPDCATLCSKEHKVAQICTSASSNGFLAAFTQFVTNVSIKKMSTSCNVIHTDDMSNSVQKTVSKPGCTQKRVRRKSRPSLARPCFGAKKLTLPEDVSLQQVVNCQSTSSIKCEAITEESLPEMCSPEDIDYSVRLSSTSVTGEHPRPTLCQKELSNIVAADCQLVVLRERVCQLLETVLPEFQFPPGFRRDSSSVERYVRDITDILSNCAHHTPVVQQCSDPVVVLHRMPDRHLQSFQQQVIRLLSLLLPITDLSGIDGDSLDVFLELLTSVNQPFLDTFCAPQTILHQSQETNVQPLDEFQLHDEDEQFDQSVSRLESHILPVNALFSMPTGLLQVNTPGPVGEKRSIRRQVKDCLMFLDRDLT